jgi:D-alanine-D-alanine ligase
MLSNFVPFNSKKNMNKKNIAIVAGGDSSEIEVSLKSAAGLFSFIDGKKYNKYIVIIVGEDWHVQTSGNRQIVIDKNDFSFTENNETITFDFAYITIHGTPGENGILQGYFDLLKIPYSSCGVLASALTFDKYFCNNFLKSFEINVSPSISLKTAKIDTELIIRELGLPVFVKPASGGSSFGITKVKTAKELQPAVNKAFAEGNDVMVEAFMSGTEVTCGMYKTTKKEVVFPVTEVVSQNEFFDFDAKYKNQSQEITPARISPELTKEVQNLTAKIYNILGCKGLIRVDYIIAESGKINLLEVNTTPGMTQTSFIPQQVAAAGLDIKNVMTEIIENEMNR